MAARLLEVMVDQVGIVLEVVEREVLVVLLGVQEQHPLTLVEQVAVVVVV
jgi:hypothetical protein